MIELLFLVLGLGGLWLGTEFVIKSALKIAEHYQLSQVFMGIAILAIGTDLPEIIISINASLQSAFGGNDTSEIIIGNAIGSSYSQISLVLGSLGLFSYLTLRRRHLFGHGVMLLGSVILLGLVGYDGSINKVEGLILVVVYLVYYLTLFNRESLGDKIKKKSNSGIRLSIFQLIVGILITIFTSEVVVHNAIELTDTLGVKQSVVGILLIGLGTSLPEWAVSINAMRKKATGLSVGNLIGSNIFDLMVPVGIGASISKLTFDQQLVWFDLTLLFVVSFLVLFFFYRNRGLQRFEAALLICIFIAYAILKIAGA